ncbi:Gfo/Idh/MocA family protein [Jeotgalibacillus proteolyticus]|uniref:Dehydrogenase n=1 Tax=Jeotgalibacillus proteolyticus TaxID=2082395 RepID=A0A2S5GCQ0_9BACL|nr:Gfo/Idh/MocA family oxidoreductase [Jeotgalibacillus proteolyticus]PPA70769.1 dehydrogenase [Jeotgalibacillus proteolyticus]
MKEVRIGMVGYKFMGKAHSHAYRDLPMFFPDQPRPVMKMICGRNKENVEKAAEQFGWEESSTDWQELIDNPEIDVIDINAPSNAHKEIALAAAAAGKHIFCEKPLALTLEDSREILQAAEEAGVKHMIGFNYRFAPAVLLAKKLIDEGRLGDIYHFRAGFLQDWLVDKDFPLTWRLQKEIAGSGSHGDLGAHLIDMAHFLVGDISEVIGMSETFVKERYVPENMTGLSGSASRDSPKEKVTVDDATLFMARFESGVLGSFEATRYAAGHRCTNTFEINGSKGSVKFDFERMNELQVYFQDDAEDVQGFRRVLATDPAHAYADAWWPPGHTIGYEHTFIHEVVELMQAFKEDRQPTSNFTDGVKCQQVLEAVDMSIAERRWIKPDDL